MLNKSKLLQYLNRLIDFTMDKVVLIEVLKLRIEIITGKFDSKELLGVDKNSLLTTLKMTFENTSDEDVKYVVVRFINKIVDDYFNN